MVQEIALSGAEYPGWQAEGLTVPRIQEKPAGQLVQVAAPEAAAKNPAAQRVQLAVPDWLWKLPLSHGAHDDAAGPALEPAAQTKGLAAPNAQDEPDGHCRHARAAVELWYWPPGQGVQPELPDRGWNEPAEHLVQLVEPAPE